MPFGPDVAVSPDGKLLASADVNSIGDLAFGLDGGKFFAGGVDQWNTRAATVTAAPTGLTQAAYVRRSSS